MKEMARDNRSTKSQRRWQDFHAFQFSKNQGAYSYLEDVGVKKADIIIRQLIAMVPSVCKK